MVQHRCVLSSILQVWKAGCYSVGLHPSYSRLAAHLAGATLFCSGLHCSALQATTLTHLYLARCITGLGIGAGVPIASIYMREISTPDLRGSLTILMPGILSTA